jgi:phospholipid/cholesterol/gamma-HCH transport system substrate-binding protein
MDLDPSVRRGAVPGAPARAHANIPSLKTKISPAMVGLFVLGAILLGLVALLYFGGVNFFSKPQRFVVFFDESIHGLDLGSPVKLRGVRVGRVTDLSIRYDAASNKSLVAVVCELSRNMIIDSRGQPIDVSDKAELQTMVDHGLRAQLGVIGLATGLLFVELDFYDPRQYPANVPLADARRVVVPAVPSTISEYQASLTEILSDLKRVDFAGLSGKLNTLLSTTDTLLSTANTKLQAVDTAQLNEHWTKAADAVATVAADPEIKKTFTNLNAAADDLRTLIAKLDQQVQPSGDKLARTLDEARQALATFNAAAASAQRFIQAQAGLGAEADKTLEQLREAAAAVQRLADFLERNPNAVITGRKPPE